MTADDFAEHMARIAADSALRWRREGLAESSIDRLLFGYRLMRVRSVDILIPDPLLDLVYCFDTTALRIEHISIDDTLHDYGSFLRFGFFDADLLGISRHDGSIAVYDYAHPDRVLGTCASDRLQFVDAMLAYQRLDYSGLSNDERHRFAEEIAEMAGGSQHIAFWKIMLGCDVF